MPRRLPSMWSGWQRTNTKRLIKDGLDKAIAVKLSRAEAWARASAAHSYGIKAALSASLAFEFLPDGSMRGRLVGDLGPQRGTTARALAVGD